MAKRMSMLFNDPIDFGAKWPKDRMRPLTIIQLTDVSDSPRMKILLPAPLRVGEKVSFDFTIERMHGGRYEVLEVVGDYKVTKTSVRSSEDGNYPDLEVESLGLAAAWKARKRPERHAPRKLGPAKAPPMLIPDE